MKTAVWIVLMALMSAPFSASAMSQKVEDFDLAGKSAPEFNLP